jgi:hypothetical protein
MVFLQQLDFGDCLLLILTPLFFDLIEFQKSSRYFFNVNQLREVFLIDFV